MHRSRAPPGAERHLRDRTAKLTKHGVQAVGSHVGKMLETTDVGALQPSETETSELSNHVIIMGFGRVGQTIAQLLSERLIPFVAVDVRVERVQAGRAADLPVYFGDAGSPAVLHQVRAKLDRSACKSRAG